MTPLTAEMTGAWQATHVFYAANPRPFLLHCVRPLVAELEADGLLAGYFFINYWLEGPHVRLRLKPSSPDAEPEVARRTEQAVDAFAERPALYEVDSGFLNDFYNTLFEIEFPGSERGHYMDEQGRMNLRPNNSRHREAYEPEFGKYGGPAGIELAEWHFRHSSDLVIDAFATKNLHLRTVLLGTSAQLMMVMASTFLPERAELTEYLDSYHAFWHRAFPAPASSVRTSTTGTTPVRRTACGTASPASGPPPPRPAVRVRSPGRWPGGPNTAPNSGTGRGGWPSTGTWSSGPGTASGTSRSPIRRWRCRCCSPRTCI